MIGREGLDRNEIAKKKCAFEILAIKERKKNPKSGNWRNSQGEEIFKFLTKMWDI